MVNVSIGMTEGGVWGVPCDASPFRPTREDSSHNKKSIDIEIVCISEYYTGRICIE